MDPNINLGPLVASSGKRTKSKGETLELLLTAHFPNSEITQKLAALRLLSALDVLTGGCLRG